MAQGGAFCRADGIDSIKDNDGHDSIEDNDDLVEAVVDESFEIKFECCAF